MSQPYYRQFPTEASLWSRLAAFLWLLALAGTVATLKQTAAKGEPHSTWILGTLLAAMVYRLAHMAFMETTSKPALLALISFQFTITGVLLWGVPVIAQEKSAPGWVLVAIIVCPLVLLALSALGLILGLAAIQRVSDGEKLPTTLPIALSPKWVRLIKVGMNLAVGIVATIVSLRSLGRHAPSLASARGELENALISDADDAKKALAKSNPKAAQPAQWIDSSALHESIIQEAKIRQLRADARVAAERQEWNKAWEISQQAFTICPEHALVLKETVEYQSHIPPLDKALSFLELHLIRFQGVAELRLLHAQLLRQMNRIDEADAEYEVVLLAGRGTESHIQEYLNMLVEHRRSDKALDISSQLLVRRSSPRLKRWRACLQASAGQMEEAIITLQGLVAGKPFDPLNAWKLGEIALEANRPNIAADAAQALISEGHEDPRTITLLGRAQLRLGQIAEGNRLIARAERDMAQTASNESSSSLDEAKRPAANTNFASPIRALAPQTKKGRSVH